MRVLAIDPGARAAVCGDFDSGPLGRRIVRTAEYGEFRLVMANEPLAAARPEGSAAAQQEDRLEDRGLAGAVLAGNQIELRRKLEHR